MDLIKVELELELNVNSSKTSIFCLNTVPVNALILFSIVTFLFIMIGKINVLAPIVTIPFLLTYATVEYAYFSLAMTFDIQIMRESRFMANAEVSSPTFDTSGKIKSTKHTDYGSVKVKN